MIICYELPIISARAVPQQINFFNKESKAFIFLKIILLVGELEKFWKIDPFNKKIKTNFKFPL